MNDFFEPTIMEKTLHENEREISKEAELSRIDLSNYLPYRSLEPSPKEVAKEEKRLQDEQREDRWDAVVVEVSDWFDNASNTPVEPFQVPSFVWSALKEQDPDYELPISNDELEWIGYEASRVLKEFTLENGYPDHLICLMTKAVWGLIQNKDGSRRFLTIHEPSEFEDEEPSFDAFKIRVIENRLSLAFTESCIRLRKLKNLKSDRREGVASPSLQIYEP
jgi:hypothetical protein